MAPYGREYYPTLFPQWDLKIGRSNIPDFYVGIHCQPLYSSANPAFQQLQLSRMCVCLFHLHLGALSLQILTQSCKSKALSSSRVPFPCHIEISVLLKLQAAYGKMRAWSRLREGRTKPEWEVEWEVKIVWPRVFSGLSIHIILILSCGIIFLVMQLCCSYEALFICICLCIYS